MHTTVPIHFIYPYYHLKSLLIEYWSCIIPITDLIFSQKHHLLIKIEHSEADYEIFVGHEKSESQKNCQQIFA